MPQQVTDNAVNDAALESVAAEVPLKEAKSKQGPNGSPADKKVADLEQQLREANERALRSSSTRTASWRAKPTTNPKRF